MSDEVTRLLDAARTAAPNAAEDDVKKITRAVLVELDTVIGDDNIDSTWPDYGDLGILAADIT